VTRQQGGVHVHRAEARHVERGLRDLPGKTPADHQIRLVGADERLDRVPVPREEKVEPGRSGGVGQQKVRRPLPAVVATRREQRDRHVAEIAQGTDERVGKRLDRADREDAQALGHRGIALLIRWTGPEGS